MKNKQKKEKYNQANIFFAILWSLLAFLFDGVLDQLWLMIIWFIMWIFIALPILLLELRKIF